MLLFIRMSVPIVTFPTSTSMLKRPQDITCSTRVTSNYLNATEKMMPQKGIKVHKGIKTWMPFWDRNASVSQDCIHQKGKKGQRYIEWNVAFPWRRLDLIYLASLRQEMHYNVQDEGKWQFNDYGTSFTFQGNWTISTSKTELVAFCKMECSLLFFSLFTTSMNSSIFSGFIYLFSFSIDTKQTWV